VIGRHAGMNHVRTGLGQRRLTSRWNRLSAALDRFGAPRAMNALELTLESLARPTPLDFARGALSLVEGQDSNLRPPGS
jgi:hypothetical protein